MVVYVGDVCFREKCGDHAGFAGRVHVDGIERRDVMLIGQSHSSTLPSLPYTSWN